MAVIAVLGGAALVLDRLWIDTAHSELRTAAEAAALAAARELASDDRLRENVTSESRLNKARFAAARIALQNVVAGEPLQLNIDERGDLRFGALSSNDNTADAEFVESTGEVTTVVVRPVRSTDRDSEVALPVQSMFGPSGADVVETAEATIDNHVVGLRSVDRLPLPTLPLAILHKMPDDRAVTKTSGSRATAVSSTKPPSTPTWQRDIEQRRGEDRFGIDSESGEVLREPDGIPEITLQTPSFRRTKAAPNVFVVVPTSDWETATLQRQIREGWSRDDLESFNGELIPQQHAQPWTGMRGVDATTLTVALRSVVGQKRVCLLYDQVEDSGRGPTAQLRVSGLIAGRVMSVRELSHDECELIFQPTVLATRSAVLAAEAGDSTSALPHTDSQRRAENKYLFKLRLTN